MPLDQIGDEKEMSFIDHLEELRWHIIRSLIAVVALSIAAFILKDLVFKTVLLGPSRIDFWSYRKLCELADWLNSPSLCIDKLGFTIQSRKMTGQFTMHITSSFVAGIVIAFPYLFWEIWRFVKPGLQIRERKATRGATFTVSFLFLLGILFGYFILTPISVNFLANYQLDDSILNEFDIVSYISTVITLVLACGILFQMPIVVYFLTKAGIISSALMVHYQKHAVIIILILGAMLTPPDPFSQVLIAVPLMGLYQVSILIAKRIEKRNKKALQKELIKTN